MNTAITIAVRVVVGVFNFKWFESRHVCWIGLNEVGKRRIVVFGIFWGRVLCSLRIVLIFCIKSR